MPTRPDVLAISLSACMGHAFLFPLAPTAHIWSTCPSTLPCLHRQSMVPAMCFRLWPCCQGVHQWPAVSRAYTSARMQHSLQQLLVALPTPATLSITWLSIDVSMQHHLHPFQDADTAFANQRLDAFCIDWSWTHGHYTLLRDTHTT
jgi:hypothetical protein